MQNSYDEKITRRLFFSMVPVQILMVLSGGINVIIDGFFASNLIGPDAMAVTGLYGPLAKILDTINALMFVGAQILCGKYLGENMQKKAKNIFTLDTLTMIILGTVGTLLFFFVPGIPAAICIKSDNVLYYDLITYLKGIAIGVIPFFLATQFTSFMQLEKKEKRGYIAIAGMFVSNSILDYVFIKVLDMGIFGLGLATALSNWVALLLLGSHFLTKKAVFRFSLAGIRIRDLIDIVKNGLPGAGSQFLIAIRGIILNNLIAGFGGNDGLAAFAAVGTFGYVYWAVPAGMTSAMITLASVYTGEQDKNAIRVLMKIYLRKAIPIVLGASLVMSALSYPMTLLFFHDRTSPVFMMTLIGFALFPLSSPFSTFIVGIRDLWRCMNHPAAVTTIVIGDGILFVIALSFPLGYLLGMTGIWIAQVAGCAALALFILILAWIMGRKFPTSIDDLCCFPEDFGVSDDKRLGLSIHNMSEVINISDTVIKFCRGLDIDEATAMRAGLCIEELAGNIVEHSFSKKSNSVVDIAVVQTDDGLVIKFKDNCAPFNPSECETIFAPNDPSHNIGLRLVSRICKQMDYQALLGLNVFSITL